MILIYKNGSRWELYPHKVKYTQHNETIEQYALPNKQWWTDFANDWEYTEIIEFTEIDITEDMQSRFEEIENMPEDFGDIYTEYVLSGNTSDDVDLPTNHPFNILKLRKENNEQNYTLLDLDFRQSMTEMGL